MDTISIVTAANDLFAPHLAVLFTSIIMNHATGESLQFYILEGRNLSEDSKGGLIEALARYGLKPIFLPVDSGMYQEYPVGVFTIESYFRLSLSELLPARLHKVIYLDVDTIVNDGISKLWNIDLSGYYLAAALDPVAQHQCAALHVPEQHGYFNSGVLVINLDEWRRMDFQKKAIAYMNRHYQSLPYVDQDVLNALLHSRWKRIDSKWNQFPFLITNPNSPPSIVHYIGFFKPWKSTPTRMLDYYKYRQFTTWKWDKMEWRKRKMPLQISLRGINGQFYMTAEGGGGREIVANRTERGEWETFWLYFQDPLHDIVYLKTYNQNYFVTAEGGGGRELVANRRELGPWEKFHLKQLENNYIALQADNGQYVCFEGGGNNMVAANRNWCGTWETFYVEII